MNQLFGNMFCDEPKYSKRNDIWTFVPSIDKIIFSQFRSEGMFPITIEELKRNNENATIDQFEYNWERKSFWINYITENTCVQKYKPHVFGYNPVFYKTALEIAEKNIPFLDICTGSGLGLIPYLLKLNSNIPCLVSDVSDLIVRGIKKCLDVKAPLCDISYAVFDAFKIPIRDESLMCVTSNYGISSALSEGLVYNQMDLSYGKDKVLHEIYRILKPGGRFITTEFCRSFKWDEEKLEKYFSKHSRILGQYTYKDIHRILLSQISPHSIWKMKFLYTGFEVIEEEELENIGTPRQALILLLQCAQYEKIYTDIQDMGIYTEELNEAGIETVQGESLFVLGK